MNLGWVPRQDLSAFQSWVPDSPGHDLVRGQKRSSEVLDDPASHWSVVAGGDGPDQRNLGSSGTPAAKRVCVALPNPDMQLELANPDMRLELANPDMELELANPDMELELANPGVSVDPVPAGLAERQGVEVMKPEEEGVESHATCLIWAYDILSQGLQRLAPFECGGLSVFGLAQKAAEWRAAGRPNLTLEASCYDPLPGWGRHLTWNESQFRHWLTWRRRSEQNALGTMVERRVTYRIRVETTEDALVDEVIRSWPSIGAFAARMRGWWSQRGQRLRVTPQQPGISRWRLDELVIRRLGRHGTNKLLQQARRERRRAHLNQSVAHDLEQALHKMRHDNVPIQLVSASGTPFVVAYPEGFAPYLQLPTTQVTGPVVAEASLRIAPRFLVWSYDVHHNGWWDSVPRELLMPSLSVFGLAFLVQQWVATGNTVHSLTAGCYSCGEGGHCHSDVDQCERCEDPWDVQQFCEWLVSRHYSNTVQPEEHTADAEEHTADAERHTRINAVGFDIPKRKPNMRCRVDPDAVNLHEFIAPNYTFQGKVAAWWSGAQLHEPRGVVDGLERWELERLLLHRLNSLGYFRDSNRSSF
ncbi:hypothetical protein GNI_101870 [Gregarina niphandrodes]|uniref:Uncharacterized protein n=1 Tax=Gregarina niphandrodes TaxID=110365 RepID=A0A023B4I7_GRENI|nr:hypothetical protein GNI_101870 [Gregarina niphandrodes]EZG56728.1 hypothetical protein GNI_101870 [Gregarina niphandrodes]|eukprot:XP_011131196.1 hypothetical protein GNI_101870 [Gregarina niphandrodes]